MHLVARVGAHRASRTSRTRSQMRSVAHAASAPAPQHHNPSPAPTGPTARTTPPVPRAALASSYSPAAPYTASAP